MMKKLMILALALAPAFQSAHAASVTNGDFMTGLTGWTTEGNVSVNQDGQAMLTSEGSEVAIGAYGDHVGVNGSILTQAINAVAGDVISFDYNFTTSDYGIYNDFSLVVADANRLISDVFTVGNTAGNTTSTGWQTFTFVATANFTNLSFILSNAEDASVDSTLLVDNVRVANTPIPAAVWLFGSAMAGVMGLSRKKKAA